MRPRKDCGVPKRIRYATSAVEPGVPLGLLELAEEHGPLGVVLRLDLALLLGLLLLRGLLGDWLVLDLAGAQDLAVVVEEIECVDEPGVGVLEGLP